MRNSNLVILSVILFLLPIVSAQEYYISLDGRKNASGTKDNPFADFATALKKVGGGNTFIFKAGIYKDRINLEPEHSGTPQSPTILKSEHKYKAVLHGAVGHNISISKGCLWVIIDGFELSGATADGIRSLADRTVIRNCWIHHNAGQGIAAHGVKGTMIELNLIEFNGSHIHYDHGIYADGEGLIVRQNVVRNNSSHGVHLYPNALNCKIENNLICYNFKSGIVLWSEESGKNEIIYNTIVANGYDFSLKKQKGTIVANNIIAYNDRMFRKTRTWNYIKNKSDIVMKSNLLWPGESFDYTEGNYVSDPKFVDLYKGAFYLKMTSPARKAGLEKYAVSKDFFGTRDVSNSKPDLGCFSYNPALVDEESRKSWYQGWPYYFNFTFSKPLDLWQKPETE